MRTRNDLSRERNEKFSRAIKSIPYRVMITVDEEKKIMVYESNFLVRKSGKRENSFYIDYSGTYTIRDLSKILGLKASIVEDIYKRHNAKLDKTLDIYYFESADDARTSLKDIFHEITPDNIGRAVYLTNEEIELIRQALINEGVNTIGTKSEIKDTIFKKLNEAIK
jgi:hypothetical protein